MKFSDMMQTEPTSPVNTPSASTTSRDRASDVSLSAMVPPAVRQAVRRAAAEQGTTVRSILLSALRQAGIADIDDAEIADRRTTASGRR